MSKKLTVIMPLYNAEEYMDSAINSILNQSFSEFDLFAIDDCSEDKTYKKLKEYKDPRLKIYQNKKNIGSLLSRNKLIKKAKTKYIAFQDADDLSEPQRLESQINFLEENSEVMLCGTFFTAIDASGNIIAKKELPVKSEDIKKDFFHRCPVVFSSIMVRKSVFDDIGCFREYFNDKGNYDFDWLSIASEKYTVSNIPEYLYARRILMSSNSKKIVNNDKIFGDKIVLFLKQQRLKHGKDALMGENVDAFNVFIDEQRNFIDKHPEYYYQWQMHTFMSYGMYREALSNVIFAIKVKPFSLQGYRDAYFILKKIMF